MKIKWLLVLALVLMLGIPAFALLDDNSTNLDNQQQQKNVGINTNTNTATGGAGGSSSAINSVGNVSGLGNKSFSPSADVDNDIRNDNRSNAESNARSDQKQQQQMKQGQAQGQMQGQVQKGNDTNVNVQGDDVEGSFAVAYPSQSSQKGQAASTVYSLFGGFSNAQTEEYLKCLEILTAIKALESYEYLSHEEATAEAKAYLAQLKDVSKERRLLGILWKTNSNHLLNGLGLLSWDPCGVNIDSIGQAFVGKSKQKTEDATTVRTDNYSAK